MILGHTSPPPADPPRAMDADHPWARRVLAVYVDGQVLENCTGYDMDAGVATYLNPAERLELGTRCPQYRQQGVVTVDWCP